MSTIDSSRILQVKGGYNFRDLGGLVTNDGTSVKRNLLFRTDELSNLQAGDLELLESLDVRTIIDFRTEQERAQSKDRIPTTCKREIHLDILSANMDSFVAEIKNGTSDLKKLMVDIYKDLVLGNNAIDQFTHFFELLQDPSNASVIYHCTAGKDRTGVATALILASLDVSRDDIETDYLFSNEFLQLKYTSYIQDNPNYADLFLVQPDYLNAAFTAIEDKYKNVQNYLTKVLKVDIPLMRKIYTQ